MGKDKDKLTNKQRLFCKEYLVDLNASAAARRAGYSEKTAHRSGQENMQKCAVREYLQKLMTKREEKVEITADYVLGVIKETVDRCRQVKPVTDALGQPIMVETPDGELAAAFKFDAKNVLKGSELLGKHINLFVEQVNLQTDPSSPLGKLLLSIASSSKPIPDPVGDDE